MTQNCSPICRALLAREIRMDLGKGFIERTKFVELKGISENPGVVGSRPLNKKQKNSLSIANETQSQ
jgi:hypothetical protein